MIVIRKSDRSLIVEGTQVDVLRKDVRPPAAKVQHYYEVDSGAIYESALKASAYDRLVFLKQGTAGYVIVPLRTDLYEYID